MFDLLLGGPGETADTVRRSLDFIREVAPERAGLSVGLRIYPGTPLAVRAVHDGLVAPDDDLLEPRFYLRPELAGELPALLAARG